MVRTGCASVPSRLSKLTRCPAQILHSRQEWTSECGNIQQIYAAFSSVCLFSPGFHLSLFIRFPPVLFHQISTCPFSPCFLLSFSPCFHRSGCTFYFLLSGSHVQPAVPLMQVPTPSRGTWPKPRAFKPLPELLHILLDHLPDYEATMSLH